MAMLRFCFGLVIVNMLVLPVTARAQDGGTASCQGLVCDLVPGSGGRPITNADVPAIRAAEEARARKVAADFDNQRPDAETRGSSHGKRRAGRVAMHRGAKASATRSAKSGAAKSVATRSVATTSPGKTSAGRAALRTGLSSYEPASTSPAVLGTPAAEKPIATIFGLAPMDVDPFAVGLQPWLDRLSWSETTVTSAGAVAFAVDGYRDPGTAPVQSAEIDPTGQAERDSLERRATALSIQGFGTLKADLPKS